MLLHLAIKDYAVVNHLELDLASGMTCITGETGAGKSIMLDALGLCIGDRADSRAIRPGETKTDITASNYRRVSQGSNLGRVFTYLRK